MNPKHISDVLVAVLACFGNCEEENWCASDNNRDYINYVNSKSNQQQNNKTNNWSAFHKLDNWTNKIVY